MTTGHTRPFTPADYAPVVDIGNAIFPDYPSSVDEERHWDEARDPKCLWARWVHERDGHVVAVVGYHQSAGMYHPRKFHLTLSVHPDYQRQGIGSLLYDLLLQALEPLAPIALRSDAREDMDASVRFLEKRGFVEDMRGWESRLDVETFDPSQYAGIKDKVTRLGIAIKTLRELEDDPRRDVKLHALEWALDQDVPSPEPPTPLSFETYVQSRLNNPDLLPDGWFVAVHDDAYVGLSNLWKSQAGPDLFTGLTGVVREYRRQGIALALKLRAIDYARSQGVKVVRTWNESRNRPMLGLNERLGFKRQAAWIDYVKVLRQE